jgi:hypothetical protein
MSGRTARSLWLFVGVVTLLMGGQEVRPAATIIQTPPARLVMSIDDGWRFSLTDTGSAAMPAFNDSAWRTVDLPHDWSAEGPFSANFGSGNGYAPGGIAWYRKHLTLPADLSDRSIAIEFDGVYDHAEVFVNGHLACGRPYGYSSFECPLTPHAKFGGADNVIAVRVDHSRFAIQSTPARARSHTAARHPRFASAGAVLAAAISSESRPIARRSHRKTSVERNGSQPAVTILSEAWRGAEMVRGRRRRQPS